MSATYSNLSPIAHEINSVQPSKGGKFREDSCIDISSLRQPCHVWSHWLQCTYCQLPTYSLYPPAGNFQTTGNWLIPTWQQLDSNLLLTCFLIFFSCVFNKIWSASNKNGLEVLVHLFHLPIYFAGQNRKNRGGIHGMNDPCSYIETSKDCLKSFGCKWVPAYSMGAGVGPMWDLCQSPPCIIDGIASRTLNPVALHDLQM